MDSNAASPRLGYPILINLIENKRSINANIDAGYLYEDNINVSRKIYRVFINADMFEYSDPSQIESRPLIYSNGGSRIYGKR